MSSIDAHETQSHGIWQIAQTPLPIFVSKRKWWWLLILLAPWGLECGPKNDNAGNWFVLQYIFTYLRETLALSWTCYYFSVHFITIILFLYFPWYMTQFLWMLFCQMLLELLSLIQIIVLVASVHFNLGIKSIWTR